MDFNRLADWYSDNRDGLLLGAAVAIGLVATMLILRGLGKRTVDRQPDGMNWRTVIGRVLAKTSLAFMVLAAADIVSTFAELPPRLTRLIDILFVIAFALQGAVWARELILGLIGRRVAEDEGESTLANAMAIIRVLVSIAVFALAIILILDNLGVNVTALVAGLGIGGIAIGLAAQGIFSDLFAALAILFDRPFRRGDTIRYDNSVGTVERIGLKTTRMRSITGEQMIMANTKLLEREIHNLAQGQNRRVVVTFGLVYHTTDDTLKRLPGLAKAAVASRKDCRFVRCSLTGFGPSALDHELLFDSKSLDPDALAADRTAVMLELLRSFKKEQVEFAYPTQTTFTAAPDGTRVMPWAHPTPAKAG